MRPGDTVRWWQIPFYAVVSLAKLAWAFVNGGSWNSENRKGKS